jgi:hypothetical protein
VGGTLSEIFLLAWEKKELNSSAIAVGSVVTGSVATGMEPWGPRQREGGGYERCLSHHLSNSSLSLTKGIRLV